MAALDEGCLAALEQLAPEILGQNCGQAGGEKLGGAHPQVGERAAGAAGEVAAPKAAAVGKSSEAQRRKEQAKARQAAMMAKMKEAQAKFPASMEEPKGGKEGEEESEPSSSSTSTSLMAGGERRERGRGEKRPAEASAAAAHTDNKGGGAAYGARSSASAVECALCREGAGSAASPLCHITLVQRSRLLGVVANPRASWSALRTPGGARASLPAVPSPSPPPASAAAAAAASLPLGRFLPASAAGQVGAYEGARGPRAGNNDDNNGGGWGGGGGRVVLPPTLANYVTEIFRQALEEISNLHQAAARDVPAGKLPPHRRLLTLALRENATGSPGEGGAGTGTGEGLTGGSGVEPAGGGEGDVAVVPAGAHGGAVASGAAAAATAAAAAATGAAAPAATAAGATGEGAVAARGAGVQGPEEQEQKQKQQEEEEEEDEEGSDDIELEAYFANRFGEEEEDGEEGEEDGQSEESDYLEEEGEAEDEDEDAILDHLEDLRTSRTWRRRCPWGGSTRRGCSTPGEMLEIGEEEEEDEEDEEGEEGEDGGEGEDEVMQDREGEGEAEEGEGVQEEEEEGRRRQHEQELAPQPQQQVQGAGGREAPAPAPGGRGDVGAAGLPRGGPFAAAPPAALPAGPGGEPERELQERGEAGWVVGGGSGNSPLTAMEGVEGAGAEEAEGAGGGRGGGNRAGESSAEQDQVAPPSATVPGGLPAEAPQQQQRAERPSRGRPATAVAMPGGGARGAQGGEDLTRRMTAGSPRQDVLVFRQTRARTAELTRGRTDPWGRAWGETGEVPVGGGAGGEGDAEEVEEQMLQEAIRLSQLETEGARPATPPGRAPLPPGGTTVAGGHAGTSAQADAAAAAAAAQDSTTPGDPAQWRATDNSHGVAVRRVPLSLPPSVSVGASYEALGGGSGVAAVDGSSSGSNLPQVAAGVSAAPDSRQVAGEGETPGGGTPGAGIGAGVSGGLSLGGAAAASSSGPSAAAAAELAGGQVAATAAAQPSGRAAQEALADPEEEEEGAMARVMSAYMLVAGGVRAGQRESRRAGRAAGQAAGGGGVRGDWAQDHPLATAGAPRVRARRRGISSREELEAPGVAAAAAAAAAAAGAHDATVGVHVMGCGHGIHKECFDRYFYSLLQRHRSHVLYEGFNVVNPEAGEFLCPMCRRLANATLPVGGLLPPPPLPSNPPRPPLKQGEQGEDRDVLFLSGVRMIRAGAAAPLRQGQVSQSGILRLPGDRTLVSHGAPGGAASSLLPAGGPPPAADALQLQLCQDEFAGRLSQVAHPEGDSVKADANGREHRGLYVWQALAYTLASAEVAARGTPARSVPPAGGGAAGGGEAHGSAPDGGVADLQTEMPRTATAAHLPSVAARAAALTASVDPQRGSVVPVLCQVAQASKEHGQLTPLVRLRGLQLYSGAIALGVTRGDENAAAAVPSSSSSLSSLPPVQLAQSYQKYRHRSQMADDLRFWQTAGEPVLAHDPFMTLVSLVFCGDDFPRSREQLLPLVHLLYAVAVVQASASVGDPAARHMADASSEAGVVLGFFAAVAAVGGGPGPGPGMEAQLPPAAARSAGGPPPGALLDLVRRGTLAFLRRCALLLHVLFGGQEEFGAAAGSAAHSAGAGTGAGAGAPLAGALEGVSRDGSGAAVVRQVAAAGVMGKGRAAAGGSKGSGETPKEFCLRKLGETAKRTGGGGSSLGITGEGAGGLAPPLAPSSSSSSHSSPSEQQQQLREQAAMALDLQECATWECALGLPPVRALLARRELAELVARWTAHLQRSRSAARATGATPVALARPPPAHAPFQLMELPRNFHDLFQRYRGESCHKCGLVPGQPLLCLFCGALCCSSSSLVTDRGQLRQGKCGEGRKHAGRCGAGIGVFLLLRVSTVLLLRGNRYCMWPSPYLDAYGEEDENLQRGKPLFLSEERYSALASLVASHGLDYSSLVLSRSARWATM